MTNRRQLITGLISFIAAPAIVRASSLMPVKAFKVPILHVGDIITFAGVHVFNRWRKEKTDQLQQFVVTANYEGGELSLYPYGHFGEPISLRHRDWRLMIK